MKNAECRLLIAAEVVLLAIMGARGAAGEKGIHVGDEVVLMSDDRPGKAKRGRPAVAFGRNVFLVAWQEGWHGDGGNSRIHAVRVGLDGKPLDAKGIEIAPCKTGVQENPRIAFSPSTGSGRGGGVFLVVWQDMRNEKDCDILGARVSPEAKVLDTQPIAIAAGPRTQAMPNVAADDKGFLVAWHGFQGEETTAKVFARRIGPDGAAGEPMAVTKGATPLIAWNGRGHLLVCVDVSRGGARASQRLKMQRMDGAGKILSAERQAAHIRPHYTSVCGVPGKGWVLVSARTVPDYWGWSGPAAQMAYSITPEGKLAADSPSQNYYDPKREPRVVAPANWLDTSLGKKRVRTPFSRIGKTIWPYGGSALAADGPCCVAAWQRYHTGGATGAELVNGDIRAGRTDGWKPLDEDGVAVAASAAEELNPALAGNHAGKLLCAYEKVVDGRTQIAARTLHTR